jgi:hypothetical protein
VSTAELESTQFRAAIIRHDGELFLVLCAWDRLSHCQHLTMRPSCAFIMIEKAWTALRWVAGH